MSKLTGLGIFITGAAVGSAATWFYAKKKYEQIAQEEIDSVKETFTYKQPSETESNENVQTIADRAKEKPSVVEYAKELMEKEKYTNYSNSEMPSEDIPESGVTGANTNYKPPYVIPPEDFGENDDYDKISLTYYSDHIVTDENDEILEDVEGAIGFESLNHFGEYEDDSVFVRNERLKVDYEILLDQRSYSDVIKSKPYLMED